MPPLMRWITHSTSLALRPQSRLPEPTGGAHRVSIAFQQLRVSNEVEFQRSAACPVIILTGNLNQATPAIFPPITGFIAKAIGVYQVGDSFLIGRVRSRAA